MAGGLAAALAGLAHLDSRKHGQQGGGCHSAWTDTVTVHAEGVREACCWRSRNLGPTGKMASAANGRAAPPNWRSKSCPRHPRLWKFTLGHRLSGLGRSRVAHAADGAARSAWPSKPSFCSSCPSFRCRRFRGRRQSAGQFSRRTFYLTGKLTPYHEDRAQDHLRIALATAALRIGQVIFDPNGEYANENAQDAGER